jgi:hypothetical protein
MGTSRRTRVTAKARLFEDPDGVVGVEVVTSQPLQDRRWHEAYGGVVERPVDYLNRNAASFAISYVGAGTSEAPDWRYVSLYSEAPVDGVLVLLLERYLDLSEGSEERRLLERLSDQAEFQVWWVNEHVQIARSYSPIAREHWKQALASTTGISKRAWKDDLADLAWRGSDSWRPGPRPRPYKPRIADPPRVPVPFFAPRSGDMPRKGRPELSGVTLPPGRRYPRGYAAAYWCTNEPVPNLQALAEYLAAAFPETGLWPLAWRFDDDPDAYLGGHGDLDAIDTVDVAAALRQLWDRTSPDPAASEPLTAFTGLAPASPTPTRVVNPFGSDDGVGADPARLLLVPCNRPADAITVLGGLATETDAPLISAVLRSWEERFAAVATAVIPSGAHLSVAAPPGRIDQALLLAAEHQAFCPREDAGGPGALRDLAHKLLAGAATPRTAWEVGWDD